MGYKFKATMYYSDSETEQFLREVEAKSNGRVSISKHLYSLVEKERNEKTLVDESYEDPCIVRMYPQYKKIQWCDIGGNISFSSLSSLKVSEASQKKTKHKDLMQEIDIKIGESINNMSLVKEFKSCDVEGFLIVIKSKLTCFYSDEITTGGYTQGNFSTTIGLIRVNRKEWERWGSRYDFKNIKYIKFRDVSDPERNKLKGLCQIAEQRGKDTAGAFFIPVRKTARDFPSEKIPQPVIMGVDINFSQDRVKFKKMNKSQKERYFKQTLDCNY